MHFSEREKYSKGLHTDVRLFDLRDSAKSAGDSFFAPLRWNYLSKLPHFLDTFFRKGKTTERTTHRSAPFWSAELCEICV